MNKALLIFDQNGTIHNQTYGDVTNPESINSMVVDVPEGKQIHHINMADPEHPEVVFEDMIEFDFEKIRTNIKDNSEENARLRDTLEKTSDELMNVQLAMIELYEGGTN